MNRREFITSLASVPLLTHQSMSLTRLNTIEEKLPNTSKAPVLFIGHGSPMNAIENNFYTAEWVRMMKNIEIPKAILCISAHWLTKGTLVTAMEQPKTIHDFYGFSEDLYKINYPAPGAPEHAIFTKELASDKGIGLDYDWGLDHGTWSVLKKVYPKANIPVYQLSIDYYKPASYHYELASQLRKLRKKGVLIIGSGNIVHNLGLMKWEEKSFDWTVEFDDKMKLFITNREDDKIINYQQLGEIAKLAVPTPDHFFPLIYTLGLTEKHESVEHFSEITTLGSISMRSIKIG
jgi:4,5-DOPA dioxygenase extradiol